MGDASVYGTRRRLFGAGAFTSYVVPSDEGPNRKYYGINASGRGMLENSRNLAVVRRCHESLTRARPGGSTTTTMTRDGEVSRYLADLRNHLGILSDSERDELLDDLRDHLAEVASGPCVTLRICFRASRSAGLRCGSFLYR